MDESRAAARMGEQLARTGVPPGLAQWGRPTAVHDDGSAPRRGDAPDRAERTAGHRAAGPGQRSAARRSHL
ncbi:hypothetical protein [Amycolatopsis thermoflava]|uniref:hypothetical protein n=1 Tax=Amycolatopsis thermoflava TaxID=84480 RepID=UPI00365AD51B